MVRLRSYDPAVYKSAECCLPLSLPAVLVISRQGLPTWLQTSKLVHYMLLAHRKLLAFSLKHHRILVSAVRATAAAMYCFFSSLQAMTGLCWGGSMYIISIWVSSPFRLGFLLGFGGHELSLDRPMKPPDRLETSLRHGAQAKMALDAVALF